MRLITEQERDEQEYRLKESKEIGYSSGSLHGRIFGFIVGSLITMSAMGSCHKDKIEGSMRQAIFPNIVHEYVDSNGNRLYDTHRLVEEIGKERRVIYEMDYDQVFGKEFSEEEIKRNFVPQGNEIRFLSKR